VCRPAKLVSQLEKPIDFYKIREINLDRFHQFSKTWSIKFKIFKYFIKIEIKNSKKIESISRFLVKSEFKNSKQHILQNSSKQKNGVKNKKSYDFIKNRSISTGFRLPFYRQLQCGSRKQGGCVSCALPSSSSSFLGAINAAACVGQYVLHASSFLGAPSRVSLSRMQKQKLPLLSLGHKSNAAATSLSPASSLSRMLLTRKNNQFRSAACSFSRPCVYVGFLLSAHTSRN
jgi:hypothetical protein